MRPEQGSRPRRVPVRAQGIEVLERVEQAIGARHVALGKQTTSAALPRPSRLVGARQTPPCTLGADEPARGSSAATLGIGQEATTDGEACAPGGRVTSPQTPRKVGGNVAGVGLCAAGEKRLHDHRRHGVRQRPDAVGPNGVHRKQSHDASGASVPPDEVDSHEACSRGNQERAGPRITKRPER